MKQKVNELLGYDGKPMPLGKTDAELATAVSAAGSGSKDNNKEDDKAVVNKEATVTVSELSPAQKEVIPMKALAFALGYLDNKQPDLDEMQAIVSSDMYIMDGHHRWAAATLVDPNKKVKVAKIEMPANDLITALNIYTKGALKLSGNEGVGDLAQWKELVKQEIEKAFEKGFSAEAGNVKLPGGKGNWPMLEGAKTVEQIKELFGKVPGANGDAEKGKEIMIANSEKLKTTRLATAPERIDMPVIDAGLTPTGEKTNDVTKSQLYDVCNRIANGDMDLKEPYSKEVSTLLKGDETESNEKPAEVQPAKESKFIRTYESFVKWNKKS
jgi:hypothetical protein